MKVGIFINTTKKEANIVADKFSLLLADNKIESKIVNLKEDFKDVDVIAVFGGDGTILRVTEYAIEYDIPIIAINIGTVGFLTTYESSELTEAVNLLKNGKKFDKRSVIKVISNDSKYYALNDVTIQRNVVEGSFKSEVVNLSLKLNDNFVDKYMADGLIVSTPTGSTAYSLSAGGAILTPDLNAFIVTPICAHSLHTRPIVFPDNYVAEIEVMKSSAKCSLFIDGKCVKTISSNQSIIIKKSHKMVKFYATSDNFFEKLLSKLNSWGYTK